MDIRQRVTSTVGPVIEEVLEEWQRLPSAGRWVLGLAVSFAGLVTLWVVLSILGWWFSDVARLSDAEPRIARLAGLAEAEDRMREALRVYDNVIDTVAYPDTGDSGRGGALLQQDLRRLAQESGATVLGSEIMTSEELEALKRLKVQVNVSGSAEALNEFLARIEAATPLLFIDKIELQSRQQRRRTPSGTDLETSISGQLWVAAYRAGSE